MAEICLRLDGLPLAIELAAARVKILSPKAILEKLENRLLLLTGGGQDLPLRQQTIRRTIDWSYELLDERGRILFRRLSVFSDGFTYEAAEIICASNGNSLGPTEILDGVTSLLDSSLLFQKESINAEPRFHMLELVHEYALEVLEASGEAETIRRAHAAYFLALAEAAEPHLQGKESVKWLDLLEHELGNIRASLRWSLQHDAECAIRLTTAISMFWILHGHLTEGRQWNDAALGSSEAVPDSDSGFRLLMGSGVLAKFQGDNYSAEGLFHRGLLIGKVANDPRRIAWSMRHLASIAYAEGDLRRAREMIEKSLLLNRQISDKSGTGHTLSAFGNLTRLEGDIHTAREQYEEALSIFQELGNKGMISALEVDLGSIACEDADLEKAQSLFSDALSIALELGYKPVVSCALDGLAALAVKRGDLAHAGRLAGAAEGVRESIGLEADLVDRRFREAYLVELRTALSESELATFYEEGRKMKLEKAVELALGNI